MLGRDALWPCLFEKYRDAIRWSVELFGCNKFTGGRFVEDVRIWSARVPQLVCWAVTHYDLIFSRSIEMQFGLSIKKVNLSAIPSLRRLVFLLLVSSCATTRMLGRDALWPRTEGDPEQRQSMPLVQWNTHLFFIPWPIFYMGLFWCFCFTLFSSYLRSGLLESIRFREIREWCKTPLMSRCQVPSPGGRIQREGLLH